MNRPTIAPVADHAVLVGFGGEISSALHARIRALGDALLAAAPAGMTEVVPAMTSLLVDFDPLVTDHAAIGASVMAALAAPGVTSSPRRHVVDVCYDGDAAPDLAEFAAGCGLAPADVIAAHLGTTFTVGMYGFAPGFAYLFGTPEPIQHPRRSTPGPPVPAGSVILAGQQCLVIPVAMSTGWYAIGRSPTRIYRPDSDRPFLVDVGDVVTFRRVAADAFHERPRPAASAR